MKNSRTLLVGYVLCLLLTGCTKSRPADKTESLKTPLPGLVLTFETWNKRSREPGLTRLVAHYVHDGNEDTQLILEGPDVGISEYKWVRPRKLILCYQKGLISSFQNEIKFRVNRDVRSFHVTLKEDC
jgi:hypothetical protein